VKRLADKPFALLGINFDTDKVDLKKYLDKEKLPWRSWWDGASTKGSITTKWQAGGAGVYVLDGQGVIRYKDVNSQDLDKAVEKLLAEM